MEIENATNRRNATPDNALATAAIRPSVERPIAPAITMRTPASVSAAILMAFAKHAAAIRIRDSFDRPEMFVDTSDQLTVSFQVLCAIRAAATVTTTRNASIRIKEII